ncbi:MAG: DUF5044 domain-containing protein [Flavonifractor plautii]
MANLPTPALRKKRILRDVCLLLLCPLVLLLVWGFPYFTRSQALWALQKANFFEGGRVVAWSSPPEDRDTAYAVLRWDGWYAVGTLRRAGPFWEPVRFNAVQPDDALPITLLFEDAGMAHSFLCVLSSDPQIVTMELDYVAGFSETSSSPAAAYPRQEAVEHCFLFPVTVGLSASRRSFSIHPPPGYDMAGNLV